MLNVQKKQNKLLQLCTFCRVLALQKTRDNLYQVVGLVAMMLFMMIPAFDLLVVHPKQKLAHLPSSKKPMPEDPFFLEICAGSARVTTCLQSLGLRSSFGVDHKRQKHAGKILVADLTTKTGQDLCLSWINSPSCMGVFCAPHAVHAAAQEAYQFSCTMV